MKQWKKTFVIAALPLALAACGGGGRDDNAAADQSSTPSAPQNTGTTSGNDIGRSGLTYAEAENIKFFSDAMQPRYSGQINGGLFSANLSSLAGGSLPSRAIQKVSGVGYQFVIADSGASITIPTRQPSSTVGKIEVFQNYQEFPLLPPTARNPSYKYFMVGDTGYEHSQFAVAATNAADPVIQVFYRGNVTPEASMPSRGSASYTGQIILLPEVLPAGVNAIGSIAANVEFGAKEMAFAITSGSYNSNLRAKIIGSAFGGKDGNKSIDGIFTGNNAEEITGGYYDMPSGVFGVFGAKQ